MKKKLGSFVILCTWLLLPAIASAATNDSVGYGVATPGRFLATADAAVGLFSAILAGLSLARSKGHIGNGKGRRGAIVAMVLGLFVIVYAGVHMTIYTGDFGTGDGRAGAIIAIMMGLISFILAGITMSRSRRTG